MSEIEIVVGCDSYMEALSLHEFLQEFGGTCIGSKLEPKQEWRVIIIAKGTKNE